MTGVLDTEETKIKDIDSINDWFAGQYLTNVRKLMLDNKKLAECSGCYKREKQYGSSPRTFINEKYKGNSFFLFNNWKLCSKDICFINYPKKIFNIIVKSQNR